jgi:hypothetical protein
MINTDCIHALFGCEPLSKGGLIAVRQQDAHTLLAPQQVVGETGIGIIGGPHCGQPPVPDSAIHCAGTPGRLYPQRDSA